MNRTNLLAASLLVVVGSIALAAPEKKEAKPAAQPEMKLPPGWTDADMKAGMDAATPGKMHEHLARDVGVWQGKNTMWMYPGADPMTSDCTFTISAMMGGRYTKCDMAGEMPGMGPYSGLGISGFDNVSQKFVTTWIDNMGTGILTGTGELSRDGKTMTWNFTYNCPIAKKPVTMRQIDKETAPGKKTMEMFGPDPKTGKEFKMMHIEYTKKQDDARASGR
jgi:hypothetical protein